MLFLKKILLFSANKQRNLAYWDKNNHNNKKIIGKYLLVTAAGFAKTLLIKWKVVPDTILSVNWNPNPSIFLAAWNSLSVLALNAVRSCRDGMQSKQSHSRHSSREKVSSNESTTERANQLAMLLSVAFLWGATALAANWLKKIYILPTKPQVEWEEAPLHDAKQLRHA